MKAGTAPGVELREVQELPLYTVHFGEGVRAAFTTRHGGVSEGAYSSLNLGAMVGDEADRVRENRRRVAVAMERSLDDMITADQVHGSRVLLVKTVDGLIPGLVGNPVAGKGDIMITDVAGPLLSVMVADCVPVLLYDPEHRAIAAVHAGWRGTAGAAVERTVSFMAEEFGTRPPAVRAAIGPSIGPCCYEVDDVVIEPVMRRFGDVASSVLEPAGPGHAMLNLWEANRLLLQGAGVSTDAITVTGLCTACDTERFFSHRAEQGLTGRIAAVITLD